MSETEYEKKRYSSAELRGKEAISLAQEVELEERRLRGGKEMKR